jgi:hypothetical protein
MQLTIDRRIYLWNVMNTAEFHITYETEAFVYLVKAL